METAICGRLPLSPNHVIRPALTGDRNSIFRRPCTNPGMLMPVSATGSGEGVGILERPVMATAPLKRDTKKKAPVREADKDLRESKKASPPYRVILHNDNYNRREYVVQVLMKVIPGMTLDNAVNIMQVAHQSGLSVVIICGQADAEDHCMRLRDNGLHSSIEPATDGC